MKSQLIIAASICLLSISIDKSAFAAQSDHDDTSLQTTTCLFDDFPEWPTHDCYFVQVRERHNDATSGFTKFPVVVFRASSQTKSHPVLHLGAGGPGASMGLDNNESVGWIFDELRSISVDQGRDLYLMDPRGSGLSEPLLMCQDYVDTVESKWSRPLSLKEEYAEDDIDYHNCIARFLEQGIDIFSYNSFSIASDVEELRKQTNTERWLLVGVSYSTIYAQLVAKMFPNSVEALILDSATFLDIKQDDRFIEELMAPYEQLFSFCSKYICDSPIENLEDRYWNVVEQLKQNPIKLQVEHPFEDRRMKVILNGHRFNSVVLEGLYSLSMFHDIGKIITEIEQGATDSVSPYITDFLAVLLDENFGDVSWNGHYCAEDKRFIDFSRIEQLISTLPDGNLKDWAIVDHESGDYCNLFPITGGRMINSDPITLSVPTLFLHGNLDNVTLLEHVIQKKASFPNSCLGTFDTTHSVYSLPDAASVAQLFATQLTSSQAINCSELGL